MSRRDDSSRDQDIPRDAQETLEREEERGVPRADHDDDAKRELRNPPHTTTGKITAPKFGSSVSGGGDVEPAPGT